MWLALFLFISTSQPLAAACPFNYSLLKSTQIFENGAELVKTLFQAPPKVLGPLKEKSGYAFRGMVLPAGETLAQIMKNGMDANLSANKEIWLSRSPITSAHYAARYYRNTRPETPNLISVIFVVKDPQPTQAGLNMVLDRDLAAQEILGVYVFDRLKGKYVPFK